VVIHLIDCMIRASKFVLFHVDSIPLSTAQHKGNVRFHPSAKTQGFPAPEIYKSGSRLPDHQWGGQRAVECSQFADFLCGFFVP
jgi:hypothetical protein